jgi:hypothetical protein
MFMQNFSKEEIKKLAEMFHTELKARENKSSEVVEISQSETDGMSPDEIEIPGSPKKNRGNSKKSGVKGVNFEKRKNCW